MKSSLIIDATGERAFSVEEHNTALQTVIARHIGLPFEEVQANWITVGLVGGMEGVTLPLLQGEVAQLVTTLSELGKAIRDVSSLILFQEYEEGAVVAANCSFTSRVYRLTGREPHVIGVVQTGNEVKWKVVDDFPPMEEEGEDEAIPPFAGQWVFFEQDVSRGSFTVPQAMTGCVIEATEDIVVVKMAGHVPGAEVWDNEVVWTQDDAEEGSSVLRTFYRDCRIISEKCVADLYPDEEVRISGSDIAQGAQIIPDDAYAATVLAKEQVGADLYILRLRLEPGGQKVMTVPLEGKSLLPLGVI